MLPKLYLYLILHCTIYNFTDYYVIEDLPFKLPHQRHPLLTNAHTCTHTHAHAHMHTSTQTCTHTLSLSLTLSLSHTNTIPTDHQPIPTNHLRTTYGLLYLSTTHQPLFYSAACSILPTHTQT